MPRIKGIAHVELSVSDLGMVIELVAWRDRLHELGIVHGGIDDYGYGLAITFAILTASHSN